jgi:hypothetical protein
MTAHSELQVSFTPMVAITEDYFILCLYCVAIDLRLAYVPLFTYFFYLLTKINTTMDKNNRKKEV